MCKLKLSQLSRENKLKNTAPDYKTILGIMSYATDATGLSDEHARMLATNWWSGDTFRQRGECGYPT